MCVAYICCLFVCVCVVRVCVVCTVCVLVADVGASLRLWLWLCGCLYVCVLCVFFVCLTVRLHMDPSKRSAVYMRL